MTFRFEIQEYVFHHLNSWWIFKVLFLIGKAWRPRKGWPSWCSRWSWHSLVGSSKVETDLDNLTFLTNKWSHSHRLIDSVATPWNQKLYRQFPTLHFFVYKIFFCIFLVCWAPIQIVLLYKAIKKRLESNSKFSFLSYVLITSSLSF